MHRIFENRVTVYEQGEGPVNTLGGFTSAQMIKVDLIAAGILKNDTFVSNRISIHNWNGMKSPVVHQYDRFNNEYFKGDSFAVLTAFYNIS